MLLAQATDPWERGTRRLILQVVMFDRLTRDPRHPSDVLEKWLGSETTRLALAAAGARGASA